MKRLGAILAVFLLLTGCTSAFVYNRLDTLVAWYLEGLVTLKKSQRADLREWLSETLDWHRDSELGRYAAFVRELAEDAGASAGRATFERAEEQFRVFTRGVADRTAREAAQLLLDLSDSQIEELIASLEERSQERLEEEQELLEKDDWHEHRAKQITKQFKRWVGRVQPEQVELIRKTAQQLQPSYPEWLESQRAWRAALLDALSKRKQSPEVAASELTTLLTDADDYWTAEYRAKLEANRTRTIDLLVALDASLIDSQRSELQTRLLKFAEDLESLAGTPEPAT